MSEAGVDRPVVVVGLMWFRQFQPDFFGWLRWLSGQLAGAFVVEKE